MGYSLKPEDKVRHEKINPLLEKAGWSIQNYKNANTNSSKGVAVEYFQMSKEVGGSRLCFICKWRGSWNN